MGFRRDLTGQRFGRLIVMKYTGLNSSLGAVWLCKCDCGNEIQVVTPHLNNGSVRSCGCLNREICKKQMTKHGGSSERLYKIWSDMKSRCCDANRSNYKYYGGRGIKVCSDWLNDYMVFRVWAFANGYQEDLTIDRIDVNKDYEPNNCRWSTKKEQQNNRRNNHYVTINGETHTLAEWENLKGFKEGTLKRRLYRGWPIEDLLLPVGSKRKLFREDDNV